MSHTKGSSLNEIFPGESNLSQLMRAHDWSKSSLGSPENWPKGLQIPLQMMLTSRFEMWLGWGPELAFFYNDAYVPTLGKKHPYALGRPMREVWKEVFSDVEDRVRSVLIDGVATWDKDLLLLLERNGYPEETYHSFSYSPLRNDQGRVDGLMCVVTEETERVISERRLRKLGSLADKLIGVTSRHDVITATMWMFSEYRKDFPFGLLYMLDDNGDWSGSACTQDAETLVDTRWPFGSIERKDTVHRIALDEMGARSAPVGAWKIPPKEAVLIPIQGIERIYGALVLGLNPHRPDDKGLAGFGQLIAGQIAGALANVDSLELERRRADRVWLNSRDLIVVVGPDETFQSISPSWQQILGHAADEVVGRTFREFVHPDDVTSTQSGLHAARTAEHLTAFENRYISKSGEVRWISWNTSLEGGLVYAYGRDITDEKLKGDALAVVEDQLRQSQKMEAVGQLTGGIAHDFNNMLAVVTGSLELLSRRMDPTNGQARRYLDAAMDGAKRSAALTQRLLAFSRQQPLQPQIVDPNRLVAEASELLRHAIGTAIQLETILAGGIWRVHVDPNELTSVLVNLAVNARDAMPEGGRLTIETQNSHLDENYVLKHVGVSPGQYVLIAVTDTGFGMPSSVIEKAFDPFFTTKEVGKGTGLGLSQVYGFIKQSNGHVKIYSEPGHGTTIKVYLPRVLTQTEPSDAKNGLRSGSEEFSEIILVVEDEAAVRMFSVEALLEAGYRVIEAESGVAALKLIESRPDISLLFTDVVMPGMNGAKLAEEAHKLRPELKILFTTGYTRNAVVHNGVLDPGVELIGKPFTIDQLSRKVREVLDKQ